MPKRHVIMKYRHHHGHLHPKAGAPGPAIKHAPPPPGQKPIKLKPTPSPKTPKTPPVNTPAPYNPHPALAGAPPRGTNIGTRPGRPFYTKEVKDLPTPPTPDFTSGPGMVILFGGALLIMSTWDGFWSPFFSTWWGAASTGKQPGPLQTSIPGNVVIGGIVFIIIASVIASMSPEAAGVIMLMLVAMWLLFIMFNGQKTLQNFFGVFAPGAPSSLPVTVGVSIGGSLGQLPGSVPGAKPPPASNKIAPNPNQGAKVKPS